MRSLITGLVACVWMVSSVAQAGGTLLTLKVGSGQQELRAVSSPRPRLQIRHLGGSVLLLPSPDNAFHIEVSDVANPLTVKLQEVGQQTLLLTTEAQGAKAPLNAAAVDDQEMFRAEEGVFTTSGASVSIGSGVLQRDELQSASTSGMPQAHLRVLVPMAQMEHISVISAFGPINLNNLVFPGEKDRHILHARTGDGRVTLLDCQNATVWLPTRGFATQGRCLLRLATIGYDERLALMFSE